MSTPEKINFKIYQGSTFNEVLRIESSKKVYKDITNITKTAPAVVTAVGHGMPLGWRCKITNVQGMTQINSEDVYYVASSSTANTVTLNDVNAVGFSNYTSGGVLTYMEPVNLSGATARMEIRSTVNSSEILLSLTTENGGIVIDNALKTVTINISASITEDLNFKSAVYSLELVIGSNVSTILVGSVVLQKEVTRGI